MAAPTLSFATTLETVEPVGTPGAAGYAQALMNILEDFSQDTALLTASQAALLNILDDFNSEKGRLGLMQSAVMNILEDARMEKHHLERTQTAVLNILDDFSTERQRFQEIQKAIFNILDDLHQEKGHLEATQTRLLRSEEEARLSLGEKETMLKEIHHRVKNNMQVICSLLSLQAGRVDDIVTRQLFEESQNRIRSMALIHEQLYQSSDFARIDFESYLGALTPELVNSYQADKSSIEVRVKASNALLTLESAIPCGLIVNELISNSLKHAFRDRSEGEIRVGLRADDDSWILTVDDDGFPLPPDLLTRESKTMGMRLVQALTRQLDGELCLGDSGRPKFQIKFPRGEIQ